MSLIIDTVQQHLPSKRKHTPSGWISFNAVCCHHNGTGQDNRQRGGLMINEGVSYHCFNCGFKASWQPGRTISAKFKKLLRWINVSDQEINKCILEALRQKEGIVNTVTSSAPSFIDKQLPLNSELITNLLDHVPEDLVAILEYIHSRGLYLEDFPFYWTPEPGFNNRLIVPFFYQNRLVGYTARKITDGKPKYISEQQPGYVFNLDRQTQDRKYVIVVEGPIDAIGIDSVAVMSAEIGEKQRILIDRLDKQVIVLPDRDPSGIKMVQQALDYGYGVSFPNWDDGIKDANDALKHYGRLYTLYSIINSVETSELKIRLRMKTWFGKE
jgi:hypothetical protein